LDLLKSKIPGNQSASKQGSSQPLRPQERRNGQSVAQKNHDRAMITIDCPFCLGLGRWDEAVCSVCHGATRISVPKDSVECGACSGLGSRILKGRREKCSGCRGTSRVEIPSYV
jgi:DnaJ-class molecular chaperone